MKVTLGIFTGCLVLNMLSIVSVLSFPFGYFALAYAFVLFSVAREYHHQHELPWRRFVVSVMMAVGILCTGAGLLSLGLTYGWIR